MGWDASFTKSGAFAPFKCSNRCEAKSSHTAGFFRPIGTEETAFHKEELLDFTRGKARG